MGLLAQKKGASSMAIGSRKSRGSAGLTESGGFTILALRERE